MSDTYNSKKLVSQDGNMLKNIILRGKLILRLMNDSRVSGLLKLLPVGSLLYLISPVDFIPAALAPVIGAADDIAVVLFGITLFLELAPPEIVDEHIAALTGYYSQNEDGEVEVIEGEVSDLD